MDIYKWPKSVVVWEGLGQCWNNHSDETGSIKTLYSGTLYVVGSSTFATAITHWRRFIMHAAPVFPLSPCLIYVTF